MRGKFNMANEDLKTKINQEEFQKFQNAFETNGYFFNNSQNSCIIYI